MAERIAIVADHAAFEMKMLLIEHLRSGGHDVLDLGTSSTDSVDYPDYGYRMAEAIASGEAERGIALCGSGHRYLHLGQPPPGLPLRARLRRPLGPPRPRA